MMVTCPYEDLSQKTRRGSAPMIVWHKQAPHGVLPVIAGHRDGLHME